MSRTWAGVKQDKQLAGVYLKLVTLNLAALVDHRIDELMVAAKEKLGVSLKRPNVDYKLRGFAAGSASCVGNRMSLNPVFLCENTQQFVDETVGHEFCHLIVFKKHGIVRYNHGKQWQGFMKNLSIPVRIDHTYDVSTILGKERKAKTNTVQVAENDDIYLMYQQCRRQALKIA